MTEVPEHLLKRSRDRRSALGLGGGDGGDAGAAAPAPKAAAPAGAVEKAAVAPVAAASALPEPAQPAPPPPPYIQAAKAREKRKIPLWAMAVLVILPLWALIYQYSLTPLEDKVEGPLAVGAEVYTSSCAACHGATGGGGTGPQLSGGEVLLTFPDFQSHLDFVLAGSGAIKGQGYGDPARPGGQKIAQTGGMPAWGSLSPEQLTGVICHERITLSGGALADYPQCSAEGAAAAAG